MSEDSSEKGVGRRSFLGGLFGAAASAAIPEGVAGKENDKNTIQIPAIVGAVFSGQESSRDQTPIEGSSVNLVKITDKNGAGETVQTAKTNADGVYLFQSVVPGLYRVSPESGGQVHGNYELEVKSDTLVALGAVINTPSST